MSEYMQVLTTVDTTEEAEMLERSITGARLAACVQIVGPIRSLYWWQDKLDDAQEWLLTCLHETQPTDRLTAFYGGNR
jgi:periplasmic divalent cation tolerance protein